MSQLRANVLFQCIDLDLHSIIPQYVRENRKRYLDGWPGCSPQQVAAVRMLESVRKKHVDDVSNEADSKALKLFLECNSQCGNWELPSLMDWEACVLGEMRDIVHKFWYRGLPPYNELVDSPFDLLDVGRLGPGASLGSSGDDFYTKLFAGPLTSTSKKLLAFYQKWCELNPTWAEASSFSSSAFGNRIIQYNRLSFVPKSNVISRTICTEPALNMLYQLGLKHLMDGRLRGLGINIPTQQSVNRELARRGSVDGSFATIDLSSASDTISTKMLQWLLPKRFLDLLMGLRCDSCQLPNAEVVPLHMISTMGNGFTFPLQTLIFAAVVIAVYRVKGLVPSGYSAPDTNFGVNGDDIIVVTDAYKATCRILSLLGFKVNGEKSFFEGDFRESCGADWFRGFPVRGFYLKDQNDPVAPYVAYNRLSEWSALTGLLLPTTLRYLLTCARFQCVPFGDSDSAGYKVDPSSVRLRTDSNGAYIYDRCEPIPRSLQFMDGSIKAPRGDRKRVFNPAGVFLAFLGGYISSGRTMVRNDYPVYRAKPAVWPREWTWIADLGVTTKNGFQQWSPPTLALRRARSR